MESADFSVALIRQIVRPVDPRWVERRGPLPGLVEYQNRTEHLTVILSAAPQADGHIWLHFSISRTQVTEVLPSWDQLVRAKEALLGADTKAIQVLPPRKQWVNIHPGVLHLWVCLDADPLPDFTRGTGSL